MPRSCVILLTSVLNEKRISEIALGNEKSYVAVVSESDILKGSLVFDIPQAIH